MTVREFLEHMDGAGLTVTDWDEMPAHLAQIGVALDTNVNDFQWTATREEGEHVRDSRAGDRQGPAA